MSGAPGLGAALGALGGGGVLLLAHFGAARRRPSLERRVEPYLGRSRSPARARGVAPVAQQLLRPTLEAGTKHLDRVLGGGASVRARLERSGGGTSFEQFRLEQLAWATACFGAAFVALVTFMVRGASVPAPAAFVVCVAAGVGGLWAREQRLDRQARRRAEQIAAELPVVAELLALAVAAGEGAAGALERVRRVCSGELGIELGRVLDDTRTGRGLADALRALADRVSVPSVTRLVDTVVLAVDRGTPLAEVLRAQAADARDVRRRELMEFAGRREIAMLVPVVFLILPVTVLFALYPGFYGLSLSVS